MRTFQEQLDTMDRRNVAGAIIALYGFFLLLRHEVGTLNNIQETFGLHTQTSAIIIFGGGFLLMVRRWHRALQFLFWLPIGIYGMYTIYRAATGDTTSLDLPFAVSFVAFGTYYLLFFLRRKH
jgi:hypothetical protein